MGERTLLACMSRFLHTLCDQCNRVLLTHQLFQLLVTPPDVLHTRRNELVARRDR